MNEELNKKLLEAVKTANSPEGLKAVEKLLKDGANANTQEPSGLTPLSILLLNNDPHGYGTAKAMNLLLDNGADPNIAIKCSDPRFDKYTPLFIAITTPNPNPALVETLLDKGANPNAPFRNANILMNIAAGQENTKILKLMIKAGANVNATDPDGLTALMYAAFNKNCPEQMITELLKSGANPNVVESRGISAIDYIKASETLSDYLKKELVLMSTLKSNNLINGNN